MATSRSRSRPWLVAAGILLVGLLVAGLLIWVFRAPLGGWAARKWCSSQDLTCELDVRGLGLSGLTVENVKITAPDGSVPVEAQRARVTLEWPGFLKPAVTLVDIKAPVVRASYHPDETDQPFRLGGLEKLMTSDSSGTSMEIPEIDVSEARIELDTPAGPVVMHGTMSGKLPYRGTVQARIEPLELTSGDDMLVLREGDVDLSFVGFKVDGSARLDLKAATFDGLSAENITLDAEMADTLQPKINW
ncbi:intermembrane phospholipid transport protein YdbH family protein, partial [Henriciella aquimarina]|uniref:intermembrane phospholipid transport protein YdbH family protein n=1 Tax=Henriciella aquimarina TaxID=545261 RepID=UPI00117A6DDB